MAEPKSWLLWCLLSTASALAPTRRQLVLGGGCATLVAPSVARANIAGGSSNSLNLRINDKITAPEAKTQPDVVLDNAVLEPLSKYANDFGDIGAAFAEEDGGGAAASDAALLLELQPADGGTAGAALQLRFDEAAERRRWARTISRWIVEGARPWWRTGEP